jgi:adenylate cyclase
MPERDRERRRLERIREIAVRADSHPAALRATAWLRSRLPGDSRFGDALSTAGREGPQVLGRRVSELQPDRASAAHALGLGMLQLWQELSEASGRGRGDERLTILFADLVGFSSWALDAGDEEAVELLRMVGAAAEGAFRDAGGTVVKRLGDGVMATFPSCEQALDAVFDLRDGLADVEVAGYRPRMRYGIHSGRPRRLGGDYFGVDVNATARIMAAADPDQVLVSNRACAELDGGRFKVGRDKRLKAPGAPDDLRVSAVERA